MQTFDTFVPSKTCYPIFFFWGGGQQAGSPILQYGSMLFPQALQTVKVLLWLVANYGYFTWKTAPLRRNTIFLLGDFSETSHLAPNMHALHKMQVGFGCDWSLIMATSLGKLRLFGGILYAFWEIFVKLHILRLTRMRYTKCRLGYVRAVIN